MTPNPDSNNRVQRRTVLRKGATVAGGITLGTGVLSGSVAARTAITEPTVIDEPGHYVVENDFDSRDADPYFYYSDTSIRINASNVTIDGNGHTITGFTPITAADVSNVTIYDMTVDSWDGHAIGIGAADKVTIQNVTARGHLGPAVHVGESSRVSNSTLGGGDNLAWVVECGSNSTVANNTILGADRGSQLGVFLREVAGVRIENNSLEGPFRDPAITLRNADDNTVVNNTVSPSASPIGGGNPTQVGISIDSDSHNNKVIRNDLRGLETPIEDDGQNTRLVANKTE